MKRPQAGLSTMTWRPEWYEGSETRWRNPLRGASVATTLIVVTSVVFVIQKLLFVGTNDDLSRWLGLSRGHALWLYPFISYMFLHDVRDLFHILFNMLVVWMFGRSIEQDIGARRF